MPAARLERWATLREDSSVEKHESKGGGDAEEEPTEMQARVDGAGVTDARDKEHGVGHDGESKPCQNEDFHPRRAPTPPGRTQGDESEHGGPQSDDGGGGDGVAARKAHIGVQEKQQERDCVFHQHDEDDQSSVAKVRRSEEMSFGKEDGGDERVRERRDPQRGTEKMPARAGDGAVLRGAG
jgi:hypothetical protein